MDEKYPCSKSLCVGYSRVGLFGSSPDTRTTRSIFPADGSSSNVNTSGL